MNSRITKFERSLLRSAIRRVFSRSELRQKIMADAETKHSDSRRPRVTKWVICNMCKEPKARYECEVDHISPVQAVTESEDELGFDLFLNRLWCEPSNLQVVDKACHQAKSKTENAQRRRNKKERKI